MTETNSRCWALWCGWIWQWSCHPRAVSSGLYKSYLEQQAIKKKSLQIEDLPLFLLKNSSLPREKQTIKVHVWRRRHLDSGKHFLFFFLHGEGQSVVLEFMLLHSQCTSMISSRLGKMVATSVEVRSSSLSRGLEKTIWRTLSIRTWACSVANNSGRRSRHGKNTEVNMQSWHFCQTFRAVVQWQSRGAFFLYVLTVDDLLPFGLLLAEAAQCFRGCHLPPVRWVRLKLQQAWIHLLQLRGGTGRGGARPFGARNCSLKTEEQKWNPKLMNLMKRAAADALSKCNAEEIVRIHQIMFCSKRNQKAFFSLSPGAF